MKEKLLCPSMMCANLGSLAEEVANLEDAGADIFHIDIMDGMYVPNFGMGLQDTQFIAGYSNKPVDVHLMVTDPGRYVELFAKMGIQIIYIHPEADLHAPRTLEKIVDCGAKAGIAINPGTAVETIRPLLGLVSYVLVMTVNPGFAGQSYLPFVDEKIDALLQLQERYDYKLLVDGACSRQKIEDLGAKGVNGFVLGTSALFGKEKSYKDIFSELRRL